MKLSSYVRLLPQDGDDEAYSGVVAPALHEELGAPLRRAIHRTRQWLLDEQHPDGYWVGELEGDTILESEYILLLAYLGQEHSEVARKAARYLIEQQREAGGWAMYPGGELEISGSVKAYFALKLTGHDPSTEYMQRARRAILAAGGADRVNSFTRFYLALLGQIPYECCPEVPPELVLLPKQSPINMYRISSWSRTIVVPLSIMSAYRPAREVSPERGIRELFLKQPLEWPPLRCPGQGKPRVVSWDTFFRVVDRTLKFARRHNLLPLRARAIAKAKDWMLERFAESDGLGAIFPPIVWSVIALDCLGYEHDSPEIKFCLDQLTGLIKESNDTVRLEPCKSPIWDTAITLRALAASGESSQQPEVQQAIAWLLGKEVRRRGDWATLVDAAPGGWYFEHNNEFYPDLDDTAMVLMALRPQMVDASLESGNLPPQLRLVSQQAAESWPAARHKLAVIDRIVSASQRAIDWMLAMQNKDGGWGAFDRDNDAEFLCHVPFADHNAMIDPSTPDLTARVLEALGQWGYRPGHSAVDRAVAYLRKTQEADGSWYGRWGVNYVYGTWQTIVGLAEVGVPTSDPAIVAGANWLLAHQQPCGGWGESADSYADPRLRGAGPVTASQTAWALLGLMAAGFARHEAVARGVRYLVSMQSTDGTWAETEFTGTGFPQVFYLRYHMYPIYFPLMAISQYATAVGETVTATQQAAIGSRRAAELAMSDL